MLRSSRDRDNLCSLRHRLSRRSGALSQWIGVSLRPASSCLDIETECGFFLRCRCTLAIERVELLLFASLSRYLAPICRHFEARSSETESMLARDALFFPCERDRDDILSRPVPSLRPFKVWKHHHSAILDPWNPGCCILGRSDAACREVASAVRELGRFPSRRRWR